MPLGRRKRRQETPWHSRGAQLQGLRSCLDQGDPRDPLTFQPGAPGPQLSSAGGWQESCDPGLPHGLGGTVAGEKRSQAASVAEEPVSPPRAAPRGQIQSRARSVRARHWARRCGRAGAAVSRGVPASAGAGAGAEVSVRQPGGPPPQPHLILTIRDPSPAGLGIGDLRHRLRRWNKPRGCQRAGAPRHQCAPPRAPVQTSAPQQPPRGLTGGSAADGDAQLQAAPGALGAGHGWAEGGSAAAAGTGTGTGTATLDGSPGAPRRAGPGQSRAWRAPSRRNEGRESPPPPSRPPRTAPLLCAPRPRGAQTPPTPLPHLWLHPKSWCTPTMGAPRPPPPCPEPSRSQSSGYSRSPPSPGCMHTPRCNRCTLPCAPVLITSRPRAHSDTPSPKISPQPRLHPAPQHAPTPVPSRPLLHPNLPMCPSPGCMGAARPPPTAPRPPVHPDPLHPHLPCATTPFAPRHSWDPPRHPSPGGSQPPGAPQARLHPATIACSPQHTPAPTHPNPGAPRALGVPPAPVTGTHRCSSRSPPAGTRSRARRG